ncbi:MAG: Glucans biosynthesis protein C [Syntrophorhabdus sp. PtaU1.Bin058]|nr:MAG: Glucans biosynthesis protein C [Syntrophorhabdus sp. PtaU1.Bin058]
MTGKSRLYYLDNLKVFLIILVIMHHVGQAYGATGGGWFYSYPGDRVKPLEFFFVFNASFFMGLFFFISGYFFPQSFDRHGTGKFIKDKLVRFGIPLLFAYFLMAPLLEYVKYVHYVHQISFKDFYIRILQKYGLTVTYPDGLHFVHLWFVEHLLVYSILYAAVRAVLQRCVPSLPITTARQARLYIIIPFILVLGIVTDLMRRSWGFPTDRWISLFGFIQMEPAHLPQYLSLLVLGILAYRWSFLDSITTPRNILWFLPGLGIYVVTVIQLFTAGLQQALFMRDYREALFCVGVCIGLLALFKTLFNRTGRIMQLLSENAFGAYIIHVPIVVAFQYAFDPVRAGAFTLFVIVSLLSIPASFLVSVLLRFIPGVKRVL